MASRIEDYAVIGNTCTIGLVAVDGSIDWLCMPRLDSPACFAALLGDENNGHWRIAPDCPTIARRRRYRADTLLLETEFKTSAGTVAITDFMPIRERLRQADVVRVVRGVSGQVPMRMEIRFRFDYGQVVPWVTSRGPTLSAIAGPDALKLSSPVKMGGEGFSTVSNFVVSAGQTIPFTLTYYPSHEHQPARTDPLESLAGTEAWWRQWSSRYRERSPWREAVVRSLER